MIMSRRRRSSSSAQLERQPLLLLLVNLRISRTMGGSNSSTAVMSDWSPVKPVTPEVKRMCLEMKSQVEESAGVNFAVYIPVDFISTNECGINYTYVIKVDVGGETCVHVKIFQAAGGERNVQDTRYPKSNSDPLFPF
uniref:Cystatin domain-containing protein n=3 Tax=Cyprinus carpio TaxID=7962 RepID=A0A9J8AUV7_CYPCA